MTEVLAEQYPSPASTPESSTEFEKDNGVVTNDTISPTTSDKSKTLVPAQESEERKIITFLPSSRRSYSGILPHHFYRITFEKTATPSIFEINDLHLSEHRKIRAGNAFQALAPFSCGRDLTLQRYLRHHKQLMKQYPSCYISLTRSFYQAERRAEWHYNVSRRAGRRITVVEISTAGLVPAEVESTWVDKQKETRTGKVPVWIRDTARPLDGSAITTRDFKNSGADMYLCVQEQRYKAGFGIGSSNAEGQWHEFMACGFIPEKYVTRAMPFDGYKIREAKGPEEVRSAFDKNYVFDWEARHWRFDPLSRKRKRPSTEDDDQEDGHEDTSNTHSLDETRTRKHSCPYYGCEKQQIESFDSFTKMLADSLGQPWPLSEATTRLIASYLDKLITDTAEMIDSSQATH
ncbi:hypothetical protein N0V83_009070 [Neocucurbitaria cava]|uniref:Uncharacterized protein n=1 Tax=Neocucurbitaria cava TaxID=798079 RepID=A0A9W8Y208_9PLEO|nr:hypothetical protein N0V83_009070 [Neocucurbitaria cava]